MSNLKKSGFKTIKTSREELEKQILEHRKKRAKQVILIVFAVVLFAISVDLMYKLRNFDSYEVKNSVERSATGVSGYVNFHGYLLEYSNDGISCSGSNGEKIWNQTFEMTSPEIEICGDYLVVYDAGGSKLLILTEGGLQKSIETSSPIQAVCIAEQGTVAVLMKEGQESQVKLFDKKGKELANGKFYNNKGGFPIDIALSWDAKKLAVNIVNVSQGMVSTTVSFYNFGAAGQNEIDNNVGSYTFDGIFIPEIDYISNTKMIAMGTGKLLVFEGDQRPALAKEIPIKEEVLSYFHNDNYVGIVYDDIERENSWYLKVMDINGNVKMQNTISILYDNIEFLANGEICVTGSNECEIFTTNSIKKFSCTFDRELYKILSGENGENYTFVFKDTIEEVRLK